MIFQLNKQEEKKAKAIESKYRKLITEASKKVEALKPETERPDNPADFDKWLESGSKEWREAREYRLNLIQKYSKELREYLSSVYEDHFNEIAKDPDTLVSSAYEEIDACITETYQSYERMRTTGKNADGDTVTAFSAREVRATKTGFLLDADETVKVLLSRVGRHLDALTGDKKRIKLINEYLIKAVADSPYTSSTEGKLFGEVKTAAKRKEAKERHTVTIPKDYVTTVDRVTKKTFSGNLVRPLDADNDSLWDVPVNSRKSKKEVLARVAIDYSEMIKAGEISDIPKLTPDDYDVMDAALSHICAGNFAFTKTMLYRVMTGKIKGTLDISEDVDRIIDDALLKFNGIMDLEYSSVDKDGNERKLTLHQPLLTYIRGEGYLNGKYIDDLIIIPKDERFLPPLLKWAQFNNNEIDTRDVTLLDVKGLNNSKESRAIKMCLYRRIIKMRNDFERKNKSKKELILNDRSIRYDYVYKALGLDAETLTKDKRHDIKTKIDKCLNYWQSHNPKLIERYNHRKDKSAGNAFYAVEIFFLPELKG